MRRTHGHDGGHRGVGLVAVGVFVVSILASPVAAPAAADRAAGSVPRSALGHGVAAASPSDANGNFVYAAYEDFLERAPSADEQTFWIAALGGGTSRRQFVDGLAHSDEWIHHVVERFYHDTLGRDPDQGGLDYWTQQIKQGMAVADVAARFYGSQEYFQTWGASDLTVWVNDLYHKLLSRVPDRAGLDYWVRTAQSSGRFAVSGPIYQSYESRSDRVTDLYEQLLHRQPDAGGLSYWAGVVGSEGDLALAAYLASSTEYFNRAQPPAAPPPQPADGEHTGPYLSNPQLTPPKVNTVVSAGTAPGYLHTSSQGNFIYDNHGEPVWYQPTQGLSAPVYLHPVTFRGQPALVYATTNFFYSDSVWHILNTSYQEIATVQAGNGLKADAHEFDISPDGTKALLDSYHDVPMDLTPYGGPANGSVTEAVVQEVDLSTGQVTFEWHSLTDVPVSDTYESPDPNPGTSFDYFHVNAVDYDSTAPDRILVSGRHVSAVYQIDMASGHVTWRLGGKRSQFTFSPTTAEPSYQHDVRRLDDGTISVYDNGVRRNPPYGRGLRWRLTSLPSGASKGTAVAVQDQRHAPDLFGVIVGSNRLQPNGDSLISFGSTGRATEYRYAPGDGRRTDGQVDFESAVPSNAWSYRTIRAEWHGYPTQPPDLKVYSGGSNVWVVTSWNGATDVARYEVWGGPDAAHMRWLGVGRRTGFESSVIVPVNSSDKVFAVHALDSRWYLLPSGISAAVPAA